MSEGTLATFLAMPLTVVSIVLAKMLQMSDSEVTGSRCSECLGDPLYTTTYKAKKDVMYMSPYRVYFPY